MSRGIKLLEDTIEFKNVPFLIRVRKKKMLIKRENGKIEIRRVKSVDNPGGELMATRKWKKCQCLVAYIRPDYPYSKETDWQDNVETHHKAFEPLELPYVEKRWIFNKYKVKEVEQNKDIQELAKAALGKLKKAYENRTEIQTLEDIEELSGDVQ